MCSKTVKSMGDKLIEEIEEMRFNDEDEEENVVYKIVVDGVYRDEIFLNIVNIKTGEIRTNIWWDWMKIGLITHLKKSEGLTPYEDD
ncbi:MAG: hypothetical protein ACRDD7_06820 [Peptostreptococcaceae bacterium]